MNKLTSWGRFTIGAIMLFCSVMVLPHLVAYNGILILGDALLLLASLIMIAYSFPDDPVFPKNI